MTEQAPIKEAQDLASNLLRLAEAGDFEKATDLAWMAWNVNPPLLPMAMGLWFFQIHDQHGTAMVNKGVHAITEAMHRAPVDSPLSRMVFCEVLYALQDNNPIRVHKAWAKVLDADDWQAANEVISLMLSFIGYYLGWFGEEGFLYEQG